MIAKKPLHPWPLHTLVCFDVLGYACAFHSVPACPVYRMNPCGSAGPDDLFGVPLIYMGFEQTEPVLDGDFWIRRGHHDITLLTPSLRLCRWTTLDNLLPFKDEGAAKRHNLIFEAVRGACRDTFRVLRRGDVIDGG